MVELFVEVIAHQQKLGFYKFYNPNQTQDITSFSCITKLQSGMDHPVPILASLEEHVKVYGSD